MTLAFPYGGLRYGQQVYPHGGELIASWFELVVDTDLPATEDPNERFQARLFDRYRDALPEVPLLNDLSWIPGRARLADFAGPAGLDLWGPGGETTFYPAGTLLVQGWTGHRGMPIETALRRGDNAALAKARERVEALLHNYFTFKNDPARQANAELALRLARNVTWRYLAVWGMDSDRADGALDSAFLAEPNSGRDWAGLACANEVNWNLTGWSCWTTRCCPVVESCARWTRKARC